MADDEGLVAASVNGKTVPLVEVAALILREIRQGLEPGERVVVRGIETLQDDQRVRVSGA